MLQCKRIGVTGKLHGTLVIYRKNIISRFIAYCQLYVSFLVSFIRFRQQDNCVLASSQLSIYYSPKHIVFRLILVLAILGFASLCLTILGFASLCLTIFWDSLRFGEIIFIQSVVSVVSMLKENTQKPTAPIQPKITCWTIILFM